MTHRLNYIKQSPELFKKFVEFLNAIKEGAIEEPIRMIVQNAGGEGSIVIGGRDVTDLDPKDRVRMW